MSMIEDMAAVLKAAEEAKNIGKDIEPEKKTEEMQAKPFEFLGEDRDGRYSFYLHEARSVLKFLPSNMSKVTTLIELTGDAEYWDSLGIDLSMRGAQKAHCLFRNEKDALFFDEEKVKKEGFWCIDGQCVYNAGHRTFIADGEEIKEVSGVYQGYYFVKGHHPLPVPESIAQGDNIGELLLKYCQTLNLQGKNGGELFAGALVHGLLGGLMDFRVHSMVNARPGSGKSRIWKNIKMLFGNMGDYQTSSTEAGVRNGLNGTSLPFVFDEANKAENRQGKGNAVHSALQSLIDLARELTANDGKKQLSIAGGGGIRNEHFKSAFMFFCISNPVISQADKERWLAFEMEKPNDNDYSARDEAWGVLKKSWDMGKFISRLLIHADVLLENVKALKGSFKGGRKSDVFSTILACRHLLTSKEKINKADIDRYKHIMEESDIMEEETSDEEELLEMILGYRPDRSSGDTYREMIIHQRDVAHGLKPLCPGGGLMKDPEYKSKQPSAPYGMKIIIKDKQEFLAIHCQNRDIKTASEGALGDSNIQQHLKRIIGAQKHQCRILQGGKQTRNIIIPLDLVIPRIDEN